MTDSTYFQAALRLAERAKELNEVPIGAVIVSEGKIIAEAYNQTEHHQRFTAHAEMLCIEEATRKLNSKYLTDCTLYITLEPCKMCLAAAQLSRIESIQYLLPSEKFGENGPGYKKIECQSHSGDLQSESAKLLADFFGKKR